MLRSQDMRPPVKYTHYMHTLKQISVRRGWPSLPQVNDSLTGLACSLSRWWDPASACWNRCRSLELYSHSLWWSRAPAHVMWFFFFPCVCHVHLAHICLWYQVAAVGTPPPHSLQGATGRLNKCLFPIWCLWTAVYQRKKTGRKRQVFFSRLFFFFFINKRSKKLGFSSHLLLLVGF